jgi:integrase
MGSFKTHRALDSIEPDHADIIRLLFLTGVRPHAILGMRRRELEQLDDPKSARWTIPGGLSGRQKNRKPHTVPLVSQALDIIRPRLEQHGQEYVFPPHRAGRSPHLLFSSKVARALRLEVDAVAGRKVPRWRVYDIRHTVATRLREDLKVSRDIVSLVLGHVQGGPEATRVYDRAELLSERRAALTAWAAWLRRLIEAARR